MNTAGGEAAGKFGPKQGRHHIANNPVEEATGLLCVNPVIVESAWILERFLNRTLGDFVEHHAPVLLGFATNGLLKMPGDGLSFTVQIRCQIDMVC